MKRGDLVYLYRSDPPCDRVFMYLEDKLADLGGGHTITESKVIEMGTGEILWFFRMALDLWGEQ